MWTIIVWDRLTNEWASMRGYSDEDVATENAKQLVECVTSATIISLADSKGEIVWAEIGSHPVIGRCLDSYCWCYDNPIIEDHTLNAVKGSSNA